MIHDILAAQKMYGADMTTRTGDTTYGFNSNAGRDAFDFEKTPWPTMAIWDAGGVDTLDASKYEVTQYIDLTPGSLSSIGGITKEKFPTFEEVNANRRAANMPEHTREFYETQKAGFMSDPEWRGRLTDNVGIAYGVTIENAKGGSGKDTIIGNDADNVLSGNDGDDSLEGRKGDDTLQGGAGADKLDGGSEDDTLDGGTGADAMIGGLGDDTFVVDDANDSTVEAAGEGVDLVRSSVNHTLAANVDNLVLTGSATNGTGNGLDNILAGNDLANRLAGGAGDDTFIGGKGVDTFTGGEGNDTFVAETVDTVQTKRGLMSVDVILDFSRGADKIDVSGLDADLTTEGHQSWSFVGHANGGRTGQLSFNTYGNINAAEAALGYDIDGIDGPGAEGPVTIVWGNNDEDSDADFAMVLYGVKGVSADDFLFDSASGGAGSSGSAALNDYLFM